jgi:hypothetical protein
MKALSGVDHLFDALASCRKESMDYPYYMIWKPGPKPKFILKEIPMGFKGRLAKCLDRYWGLSSHLPRPLMLKIFQTDIGLVQTEYDSLHQDRIANSIDPTSNPNREQQLEVLVGRFEIWLDQQELLYLPKPRIFTDESGKKYEIREVKE